MKYKILKTLAVMVFVAGFMMVLKSCKKVDNTTLNQANKPTKEQLLAKLKLEIEKNPEIRQTIIPINQKVEGHWEDLKGNIITSLPSRTLSSTNHAARVYECASAEDVSYPPGATLTTIGVDYDCTSGGYFYTLTYNVSISVNLVNTSPFSGSVSRGRIKLFNSSGVNTYSNTNITPVTITYLGDDPSTANNNGLYKVVFKTPTIANSYFTSGTTFQSSLLVYTDCADLPSYVTSYTPGIGASISINNALPCNRIDPIALPSGPVNNVNSLTDGYGTILGFGNVLFTGGCQYPASGTYPDRQEIQLLYNAVPPAGSAPVVWETIHPKLGTFGTPGEPPSPFNATTQAGTIGLYDAYTLGIEDLYQKTAGTITTPAVYNSTLHGSYLIRWRNVKLPLVGGCVGPWSTPKAVSL